MANRVRASGPAKREKISFSLSSFLGLNEGEVEGAERVGISEGSDVVGLNEGKVEGAKLAGTSLKVAK